MFFSVITNTHFQCYYIWIGVDECIALHTMENL